MADKQVIGGLKWVKHEIRATLQPVRELACGEAKPENQLGTVLKALEQVQGVLLALNLYTPARLVEEIQHLVERLGESGSEPQDQTLAVIGQALDQLNNHLDRLDAGFEEPPLSLWSIINALRTARDQLPLTHSELLSFALLDRTEDSQWIPEELDILAEVIRQVRPQFHRHLVEWYRGDTQGLAHLESLFHQLKDYLREGLLADLFALAERFAQLQGMGQIEITAQTRTLMGHLDWIFKPLTQHPPVWPEIDARALINKLLEYLDSAGVEEAALAKIRLRYAPTPPAAQAAAIQGSLGDDPALVQLASACIAELDEIKGIFDGFATAKQIDREAIRTFSDRLRRLAARLDDVEIGHLPARLRALAEQFQALDLNSLTEGPERLESYAMELLGIESVLLALASQREFATANVIAPDLDLTDLTAAALREASYELLRVKEAVEEWQRTPQAVERLSEVPRHLANVAGALRILSENPAAELAELVGSLVQAAYLQRQFPPTANQFEPLAEAIAGLELYIGHLQEPMPLGETLIDRARRAISALQTEIGPLTEGTASESATPQPTASPELVLPPLELVEDEGPGAELTPLEPKPAQEAQEEESDEGETGFIEIFREEAGEEIAKARDYLARLQANPTDTEARDELRRCFHTLKGSGRLVGALQVGDFAQAMEFLLNRLIELQLPPSPEVLDCLVEAVRVLPALVEADTSGQTFATEPYIDRATQLRATAGQPASPILEEKASGALSIRAEEVLIAPETEATPEMSPPVEVPVQIPVTDREGLFAADAELLAIFRTEAEGHLDVLRLFVAGGMSALPGGSEALIRALHTLTGSARMSGVESIARVTRALEEQVRAAIAQGLALSQPLLDCFGPAVAAIEQRLAELPETGAGADALAEVLAKITAHPPLSQVPAPSSATIPTPELEPAAELSLPALAEEEMVSEGDASSPTELLVEESLPELAIEFETPALVTPIEAAPETIPGPAPQVAQIPQPEIEPAPEMPTPVETAAPEGEVLPVSTGEPKAIPETAPPAAPSAVQAPEPLPQAAPPAPPVSESQPDPELVGVFLEEARDLLDKLDQQFRGWLLNPKERTALAGINRLLHTLKGGARLAGLMMIGNLAHALETRLKAIDVDPANLNDLTLETAQRAVDMLALQVDAVEQGSAIPQVAELIAELSGAPVQAPVSTAPSALQTMGAPDTATPAQTRPLPETAPGREAGAPVEAVPQIRVRADLLNRLVNQAGEVSIYRSRLSQRNSQLGFSLFELDQTVIRLREQLRQLEIETQVQIRYRIERDRENAEPSLTAADYDQQFDPLEFDRFSRLQELSGFLAETINDLVSVKEILGTYQREITDLLNQQARLADDLQDGLLRTRMVPFVQVVPRLQRLVRQTADTLGKSARLEIFGPEVELDRTILDRLVAPLEHLLRNAVDHGIEDTKTRVTRGKPVTGLVTLALRREGNDVVISLSDDGRGLDLEAIRQQAIRRGLMTPDSKLPDEAILQFIMEPGFTTSGKVTQISGRGVGLDVVASEIKAANGTLQIESIPGKGARFTIRLPLTLALIDAFLVTVGETVYAVPHSTVESVGRINRDELLAIYAEPTKTYTVRGQHYRIAYLGQALEPGSADPDLGERRWLPLLLARIGDQCVALQADSMLESQRILVKPLGPQLAGVRWLSGGTILPDGRVALILDALALVRSGAIREQTPVRNVPEPTAAKICVLVVDDSLTVRRVTSRLLKRQNMEVITAKDGVEALTLLDERLPDVVLLDVEMPRMDGYELTRHIRRSERLKQLPIIMITSRTGTKHREYAAQLGVDRYLGKPYQEAELLAEIEAAVKGRH
ncbi:response regulator [Caldichromatium japonicum]|uniref:Chemotaxis protein CheA n=1 Tax=Caldichromatium japonicum TaxID=2699430 RepID=A0A6G7VFG2_9GAMM|nr:Hpt domain-containing protein [Caldichromatium japonicum]QIK38761.1 response regulator [Caldichromatium japonicum]